MSDAAIGAGAAATRATAPELLRAESIKRESVPIRALNPQYPKAFVVAEESVIPEGPVVEIFKSLEAAALNGNAHAGYVAFRVVYRCHEKKLAEAARDAESAKFEPERLAHLVAGNEKLLQDCHGVGAAEIAKGFELLRLAAERGDIEAELTYPAQGLDQWPSRTEMLRAPEALIRFRDDAMRFLYAAAGRGNETAMAMLALAYYDGTTTRRDPVKAYSYAYARSLLMQPLSDSGERVLAMYARDLSPDQQQAGQAQALVFLERCCR
ncbi:MAG TPA: hypothetical protein VJ724_12265 [Tahibacter sp.]|nr:hypothetical protein [Tahibacter sp.]